jgi:DNA repair exonuclease SbcCD nuclease subunit
MPKLLLVGDVHAVVEEIDDCQALIDYICRIALETESEIVFCGDLYNTMAVVRVEVMDFWIRAFSKMKELGIETWALVGNHDFGGAGTTIHSLSAHKQVVNVVDYPRDIVPGVLGVPFYDKSEDLISESNRFSKCKTLLAHQTFTGAKYDNNFYAPDGVDPDLIPQENIISGHIHSPQSFGKVTYIGAPRWRTLSDANIERAIWLYEFDGEGTIVNKIPFSTGTVCRQIKYLQDTPSQPIDTVLDPGVDYRIDIKGPADWIEKRKAELAGPGVKIRTFKTTGTKPVVKESDGIGIAFRKYLEKYTPRFGTDKECLIVLAKDRLNV